jgi:hypothetical protein
MSTTVDETVRELAHRLPSVLLRPPGILLEVRDGLDDAAAAYGAAGMSEDAAVERAIADFGDLDAVAWDYLELTLTRSTWWAALALGPGYLAILAAWDLAERLLVSPLPHTAGLPLWAAFPIIGMLACALAGVSVFLVRQHARTGRSNRVVARTTGLFGLGCGIATLAAAYLVERRQRPAGSWSFWSDLSTVEVTSAALTMLIIVLALRLLLTVRWVDRDRVRARSSRS